jgi:FAD/FMN-containing dehydrogenase
MAKHGLAADNLLAVEIVTAAGEVLQADDASYPDLMWALRGGGGNFGVVTSFTYRLHPVATITGGLIAHPFDAAPEVLRFYREAVTGASDDLTVFAGLVHAPDGSGAKLTALVVFHTGAPEVAESELEPLLSFGAPLMTQVGPMPYEVMNTLLDGGFPEGACNYWLSSFTMGLSDRLIDVAVERFTSVPTPMGSLLFEHFHGAVTRRGVTETAVPHREPGWNLLIPTVWTDPADSEACIRWTRETFAALQPNLAARRWLSYLGDDQGEDAIRDAYGPNYDRLRQIKRRYDPDNVFRLNHNITPEA